MKAYQALALLFFSFQIISCGDAKVEETVEPEEKDVSKGSVEFAEVEIDDQSYEEDELTAYLDAINISTESDKRSYTGFIGETPIILEYWDFKKDELAGHCFYPNNGVLLELDGMYESGSVYLRRMKDGKIRETFNLDDVEGNFGGEWEKEGKTKEITLNDQYFSTNQSQYFIDFLKSEIVYNLVDLWMYDPSDFDNLKLNNGGVFIYGGDGGTSGRTEIHTDYQALELNPEGESWYFVVEKTINESWYSMEELEEGSLQEDLKEENTHYVSISINKLKNGESEEVDSFVVDGYWDASVVVGNGFVIIENDAGKNTFVWDANSKKMEGI